MSKQHARQHLTDDAIVGLAREVAFELDCALTAWGDGPESAAMDELLACQGDPDVVGDAVRAAAVWLLYRGYLCLDPATRAAQRMEDFTLTELIDCEPPA